LGAIEFLGAGVQRALGIQRNVAMTLVYRMVLLLGLAAESGWALERLPEGLGLSKGYLGDVNIGSHPAVLLVEDFEASDLAEIKPRWNEMENPAGRVLELVAEKAPGSVGKRCLQVTATLGENTGGHLFKRLNPIQNRVFARFYVKFAEDAPYLHHFSGLGGYNPPTNWPQGSAGKHAAGDARFSARIEPNGQYGSLSAPGGWMFYSYWHDMKQSADGGFWGNGLWPEGKPGPVPGQWQCVEIMVKCNEVGKSDGELALWLDGKLAAHIGPGTRTGKWTGEGFEVLAEGQTLFEGFRWRTVPELAVSYFSLSHYVTENAYRQNQVANPPKLNRVWFDDVVVATEYVGPIANR
jgi:hypothetical protein